MRKHVRQLMLIAAVNLVGSHSPAMGVSDGAQFDERQQSLSARLVAPRSISILSYNVKGLPWPVAWGREAAIDEIGIRLAAMRRHADQPDVVILQEAFGETAQQIAHRAGYRHIALGPDVSGSARYTFDVKLSRDWTRGEGVGRQLNSGLAILSDHPIQTVEMLAFGEQACAGFDCLANKGIMKVALHLPGNDKTITIFNTHLNARKASGVTVAQANRAVLRQLQIAGRFISDHIDVSDIVIVAGDFNIGSDSSRRRAFSTMAASEPHLAFMKLEQAAPSVALAQSLTATALSRADLRAVARRSKDLMFFSSALRPIKASVPFGTEVDGSALSDHFGYRIDFALPSDGSAAMAQIAARKDSPKKATEPGS
ncbi:MAG: endonuclease/exonuclease/phosphatase family protein [Sphingobium sp.]